VKIPDDNIFINHDSIFGKDTIPAGYARLALKRGILLDAHASVELILKGDVSK
jgi:hypothetical protein